MTNKIYSDNPILSKPISYIIEDDEMPFYCVTRTANILRAEGINYVKDLIQKEEHYIKYTHGVGEKALKSIKKILAKYSLSFGMEIVDTCEANKIKIPFERERIGKDGDSMCRYAVIGGWIVRDYSGDNEVTSIFIPDPNHLWEIE